MNVVTDAVRLPSTNDSIAPVRILDADGNLVCVVSADEFRRTHPTIETTDSTSTAPRRRPLNHLKTIHPDFDGLLTVPRL